MTVKNQSQASSDPNSPHTLAPAPATELSCNLETSGIWKGAGLQIILDKQACLGGLLAHSQGHPRWVSSYLEPPALAVGVLIDGCHLHIALLTQLDHRFHKALQL